MKSTHLQRSALSQSRFSVGKAVVAAHGLSPLHFLLYQQSLNLSLSVVASSLGLLTRHKKGDKLVGNPKDGSSSNGTNKRKTQFGTIIQKSSRWKVAASRGPSASGESGKVHNVTKGIDIVAAEDGDREQDHNGSEGTGTLVVLVLLLAWELEQLVVDYGKGNQECAKDGCKDKHAISGTSSGVIWNSSGRKEAKRQSSQTSSQELSRSVKQDKSNKGRASDDSISQSNGPVEVATKRQINSPSPSHAKGECVHGSKHKGVDHAGTGVELDVVTHHPKRNDPTTSKSQ